MDKSWAKGYLGLLGYSLAKFLCITCRNQLAVEEGRVRCHYVKIVEYYLDSALMKMLQLHHCLLYMAPTLKNLTKKKYLQTYDLNPYYLQLKSSYFISAWLVF